MPYNPMNQSEKLVTEASRLIARAYAKFQLVQDSDPVDALAAACTKSIQAEGACLIPLTEKSFHAFLRENCSPDGLPNRATRIATMPSFFAQREAVAFAAFEGIKFMEQWDKTCLVHYTEDSWRSQRSGRPTTTSPAAGPRGRRAGRPRGANPPPDCSHPERAPASPLLRASRTALPLPP